MSILRRTALAAAIAVLASPTFAEEAHHPSTDSTSASSASDAASGEPSGPSEQPGSAPMMMPMMPMMMPMPGMTCQGGMSMMGSAGKMGTGSGAAMGMTAGAGPIDHVEGRIAFLRAELKISDAQSKAWDAFADALRDDATRLNKMGGAMMQRGAPTATLAQRFDRQERMLSSRLDGVRAIKTALQNLLPLLDDEQSIALEELAPMQFDSMM